jgi:hypothetical protein
MYHVVLAWIELCQDLGVMSSAAAKLPLILRRLLRGFFRRALKLRRPAPIVRIVQIIAVAPKKWPVSVM